MCHHDTCLFTSVLVWAVTGGKAILSWNNTTNRHQGQDADGHTIEVDGDVFAEELREMATTYQQEKELSEEEAEAQAFAELSCVNSWNNPPRNGLFIDGIYQG